MVLNVYSVLDCNVGYGIPVVCDNDAVAMRKFENGCCDKSSVWYTHCSDFCLMYLGTFDTASGELSPAPVRKVCDAYSFVARLKGEDNNEI